MFATIRYRPHHYPGAGHRDPSETCRDRAQSHPDCGDSRSSRSKRRVSGILKRKGFKNILTLKMATVESVTSSDALKKSADTVAKAAFNKTDKGDFCSVNDPIRSKAIFSEP